MIDEPASVEMTQHRLCDVCHTPVAPWISFCDRCEALVPDGIRKLIETCRSRVALVPPKGFPALRRVVEADLRRAIDAATREASAARAAMEDRQ